MTLYFALIVSLPVILYELYGFVLPALKPNERRVATPLLTAVPFLFAVGVAFGYFVVLPAAIHFFVNFNADQFNVIVQAGPYYAFAATILLAMGLVFQVPVVILGATRARARHAEAAAQGPPLRDRRLRGHRRAAARRSDHDAAGDGAAVSALRGEYSACIVRRAGGCRAGEAMRAARPLQAPGIPRRTRRQHHRRTQRSQPCRSLIDHIDPGLSD